MELKTIECDPACGFVVRSADDKEIVAMAKQHFRGAHPEKKVAERQLRGMVRPVGAAQWGIAADLPG